MKRTGSGRTYKEVMIGEFCKWANIHGVHYMAIDQSYKPDKARLQLIYGNYEVFDLIEEGYEVFVHNNKLGYADFKMLTRCNGQDLLAVILTGVTPSILKMVSLLGAFNGIPVSHVVKAQGESNIYLLIFSY
ncbi:MAG: hypothetical protein IKL63_06065 [Alistipes sp.]|nr:hypothetical protein [Alistipes sp.]